MIRRPTCLRKYLAGLHSIVGTAKSMFPISSRAGWTSLSSRWCQKYREPCLVQMPTGSIWTMPTGGSVHPLLWHGCFWHLKKQDDLCNFLFALLIFCIYQWIEGNGNPLQYSFLENSMDRGPWLATVHWVAKEWTQLNEWTTTLL